MNMLPDKSSFISSESLHEQLKASAKSVLLTNIKFKEAMYPDEEELNIKDKYKPINPQFQQNANASYNFSKCNGYVPGKKSINSDEMDDMPTPKVILYPPEKVELHWKETRRIGPGLCNLGNTCFLNSVLQALTYTAPLVNFISSDTHRSNCEAVGFCMLCELRNHFFRVLKHNPQAGPIRPLAIVQKLSYIGKQFKFGRQEDAHEFLRYVIEGLQKSCLAGKPKLDKMSRESTVMNQIFGGFYRSQVICLACKHRSNTYDPMLEMNLDVKEANSIENALRRSVRPEKLDGENKYQCDRCSGKRPAIKRSTIHKCPNVFTVQFKRFDFNRMFGGKISKHVSYSEELNLRPFMSTTEGHPVLYGLYAVLVHSGFSCNSGHYYCYVKAPNGAWYEMNDSRVSQVSIKTVLNTEAYLLFYIRKQPNRDKKVMNGNGQSSQAAHSKHKQAIPSPFQTPNAASGAQKMKETPKESKPCPKLIPLTFNDTKKFSFKFNKSNNTKDSSKLVVTKQKPSTVNPKVITANHDASLQSSQAKKSQEGTGLSSIDRLKQYDSDESSEDEKKKMSARSSLSSKDKSIIETTSGKGGNGATQTITKLQPTEAKPVETKGGMKESIVSANDITSKVKKITLGVQDGTNAESKGSLVSSCSSTSEIRTSTSTCQSKADDSSYCSQTSNGGENKENMSLNSCSNDSQNCKSRKTPSPTKSDPNSSKHHGRNAEEPKSRSSHSHSKAFLFSPPLVPAIRPWLPVKHCVVPRSVYKRSISEPDPASRKHHQVDSESTPACGNDQSTKSSKWHTLERQRSEHLFGPMTPPMKEDKRRERTNSINSEASSVASVSSKVGEWEVHEKEQDDFQGAAKIPERQFAGWKVQEQGEKDDPPQVNQSVTAEDETTRKEKKKKKRKKKKRSHLEEKTANNNSSVSENRRKRRRDDDNVETEHDCCPKKAKKRKKKKNKKDSSHKTKDDSRRLLEAEEKPPDQITPVVKRNSSSESKSRDHEISEREPRENRVDEERRSALASPPQDDARSRKHSSSRERSSSREHSIDKDQRRSVERSTSRDKFRIRDHGSTGEYSKYGIEKEEKDSRSNDRRISGSSHGRKGKHRTDENLSKRAKATDSDDDSSDSVSRCKRSFWPKKSKDRSRSEDIDRRTQGSSNEESVKRNAKDVPCKRWDDNRVTVPEGTTPKSDVLDSLFRDKARALGSKVKSWEGDENMADSVRAEDERRRKRDKWDDEYDEGRTKKVKSHRKHTKSKGRRFSYNPFQRVQDSRKDKKSSDYSRLKS